MKTSELYCNKIKIRCRIIMHLMQVNETCKLIIIHTGLLHCNHVNFSFSPRGNSSFPRIQIEQIQSSIRKKFFHHRVSCITQ